MISMLSKDFRALAIGSRPERAALIAITVLVLPFPAIGQFENKSVPASFETCIATIQHTATTLGIAPVNIMETTTMRMVRFPTDDGSVLITCAAGNMQITISPKKCGVDVNC